MAPASNTLSLMSRLSAAMYDPILSFGERAGMREWRRERLARASGVVVEIGAGTGLNFQHYGEDVEELLPTEPDEAMARRAGERLRGTGRSASVIRAGAEALPMEDGSVDTVVGTLVLCTVPDPEEALGEINRVLKPGGRFLFVEHVRSESERLARWQDRLMRPWRAFANGCRCNQDTLRLVEGALSVDRVERQTWRGMPPIVSPVITGEAVR